jgi:hypothetical protein
MRGAVTVTVSENSGGFCCSSSGGTDVWAHPKAAGSRIKKAHLQLVMQNVVRRFKYIKVPLSIDLGR